jgi:hypothetical protein
MKLYPHWGSHLPLLMKIVPITEGSVLELGLGFFSTPVLHWLCYDKKRELVSYDDDVHYVKLFRQFGHSDYHKIFMVEDWDKIPIERLWDVVLIDHRDSRRRIEAKRLANYAKYVILHDSNPESNPCFRYSEVYPRYKYRHDYTSVRNHVTVLSNFVDLSNL